jgi:hypothetical protein
VGRGRGGSSWLLRSGLRNLLGPASCSISPPHDLSCPTSCSPSPARDLRRVASCSKCVEYGLRTAASWSKRVRAWWSEPAGWSKRAVRLERVVRGVATPASWVWGASEASSGARRSFLSNRRARGADESRVAWCGAHQHSPATWRRTSSCGTSGTASSARWSCWRARNGCCPGRGTSLCRGSCDRTANE